MSFSFCYFQSVSSRIEHFFQCGSICKEWICSFSKYLLSAYPVPGSILSAENVDKKKMKKETKIFALIEFTSWQKEAAKTAYE